MLFLLISALIVTVAVALIGLFGGLLTDLKQWWRARKVTRRARRQGYVVGDNGLQDPNELCTDDEIAQWKRQFHAQQQQVAAASN